MYSRQYLRVEIVRKPSSQHGFELQNSKEVLRCHDSATGTHSKRSRFTRRTSLVRRQWPFAVERVSRSGKEINFRLSAT